MDDIAFDTNGGYDMNRTPSPTEQTYYRRYLHWTRPTSTLPVLAEPDLARMRFLQWDPTVAASMAVALDEDAHALGLVDPMLRRELVIHWGSRPWTTYGLAWVGFETAVKEVARA